MKDKNWNKVSDNKAKDGILYLTCIFVDGVDYQYRVLRFYKNDNWWICPYLKKREFPTYFQKINFIQ